MRRRKKRTEAVMYRDAIYKTYEMERQEVYRAVVPDFDLDLVIRSLWREDILAPLRAAFPYTHSDCHQPFKGHMLLPGLTPGVPQEVHFSIDLENAGYLLPLATPVFNPDIGGPVINAIKQTFDVAESFNKVRRVLDWMEQNASAAAARHYFPGILNLLPADHAVHEKDGMRFMEPKRPISEIAPALREATGTVAAALLFKDREHPADPSLTITFAEYGCEHGFF